ncbi:sporulation histidine kinase inhibitor Sda [Aquibacillus salsiterrae]|uniref:Sporulation histidine kinase inhibitor Sda n=1 Tax=Aquibacillus salsiterrae TaxID=2950439 RepID=A0A9X3WBR9_9BACI|nr:sporulation histidine kinase inhibitor Sda [Aquibacillus salsiterrae]MDC3415843.1 sporulation histidine kinase inhibitor Sda [Aquibacillus salsiterrae]
MSGSLTSLNDTCLLNAYEKAILINLEDDFIELLYDEICRRGLIT